MGKRCLSLYADLKGRCELCPMSQVFSWIDPKAGIKEYEANKQIPCDTCKHWGENGAIDPTGEDYCPLDPLCNNASLYEKRGGDECDQ